MYKRELLVIEHAKVEFFVGADNYGGNMRFICDNCNLGHEVEEYREKLEDVMIQKNTVY